MTVAQSALLRPITVGSFALQNRVVMGSMHTGLEGHPERFDELARFYAERARGGVALIVTGGFSPNHAGRMTDEPCTFDKPEQVVAHRKITSAVHTAGGRILLQILHAGRYGYHPDIVAPSAIKSPINRDTPRELLHDEILQTIEDYAATTRLAIDAGYDGVEVMGSEGYILTEFLALRTNKREDEWGGSLENRAKFPLAVVRAVRNALGSRILSFRISALELIEGGLTNEETLWFAREVEKAGADCLSTGIGWHESTVPTIAGTVPHYAFIEATKKLKNAVTIPVTASNRINLPDDAEKLIESDSADLVSMARPFLADPNFVEKVKTRRSDLINICIACNQACLDHYFTGQVISCLVNPRAVREDSFIDKPAARTKRVAVVGAGVAGIAAAIEAGRRGHVVTLYEGSSEIGGQFILAAQVPGKEDYGLAITGFKNQLAELNVDVRTNAYVSTEQLLAGNYDEVIISTGISPRELDIPGSDDPRVVGYTEVLNGIVKPGNSVVIVGGGGIGHDVALFLTHGKKTGGQSIAQFEQRWGINTERKIHAAKHQVTMVKRSAGSFGKTLGKSTGWILRQELKDFGVRQIAEAKYLKIDQDGLHIAVGERTEVLAADTIVVCAGQISSRQLADELEAKGQTVHVIGGAKLAGDLDAKRAIYEGALAGNRL